MTDQARTPHFELVTAAGRTVRAALWRAPAPAKGAKAPPILFFNGIGANIELMEPLAAWFPERDIVTFDMPGVGGSPTPVLPYRPWMIARLAAKILDHFGFREADVIGVSWGGGLAQQFALQHGKRVRKLILAATSAGALMVPGDVRTLSKMASPRRYFDPKYMRAHFETLYGDEVSGGGDGHLGRISPPTRIGYLYQLAAMIGWTSAHFLPFIKQPTLVLMGDRDSIVPLINGRILARLLPRARLEIIEGAGHLFLVTKAEESARRIRAFLEEPTAAASARGV